MLRPTINRQTRNSSKQIKAILICISDICLTISVIVDKLHIGVLLSVTESSFLTFQYLFCTSDTVVQKETVDENSVINCQIFVLKNA